MLQEREQLKIDLKIKKARGFVIDENDDLAEYVSLMLKHIGDVDPELRDELIYEAFYYWIREYHYLNVDELRKILLILINEEHLFYKIGACNDDSVFTRSFSSLVLSLIIFYQKEEPFLDKETFGVLKNALIRYYKSERDFRGLIEKKGWAHSIAHGADALRELVQCQVCDESVIIEVLDAIEHVLFNGTCSLCYKEDERIANIVHTVYANKLISNEKLMAWLYRLGKKCDFKTSQSSYISSINVRNLIRSIYFKLVYNKFESDTLDVVLTIEKSLGLNHI